MTTDYDLAALREAAERLTANSWGVYGDGLESPGSDSEWAALADKVTADGSSLARHFLALLDSGELVRVKPLEWKLCNRTSIKTWRAETVFGELVVQSKYFWFANDGGGSGLECKSIADGKVKAEAHYRFRLAAALEPIIPMETNREAK